MKSDDFEWDDAKAASNRRDHKITFEQARQALADPFIVEWIDQAQYESEQRFSALGMVENRLLFVAYTIRGNAIRIILARRAEPWTTTLILALTYGSCGFFFLDGLQ